MYSELVKRLRSQCKGYSKECKSCGADGSCRCQMEGEAADAIEKLTEYNAALNGTVTNLLEQIKDLGKPCWVAVTEPPKEE